MNKSAVALAADSAATVTSKVFNSAEKLFMLVPGQPVGLLIYNHSEFMQLPWETIVKKYRDASKNKAFETLQQYADDFLTFLGNNGNGLYSDEQFEVTFGGLIYLYLLKLAENINNEVRQRIEDKAKKISEKEILDVIQRWIDDFYLTWNKIEDIYPANETSNIKKGLKKYLGIIDEVRDTVFGNVPLTKEDKKKIEEFCFFLIYKKKITEINTGIVIAGFGEKELYPACVEYIVENYFCGHLKYSEKRKSKISPANYGCIIPYAQEDVVTNFMDGIHPDYERKLQEELNNVFDNSIINELNDCIKGLRKTRKEKIFDAIKKVKTDDQEKIIERAQLDFKKKHTDSILQTVGVLPKDELAKMAESLVNITSFMRRVSMEIETVGGPIDVAVISKKDGFIWIKRKHYFDLAYNQYYRDLSINGESK